MPASAGNAPTPNELTHLHGQTFDGIRFDAETREWLLLFSGQLSLPLSAPWRVVADDHVAVEWNDDGHQFGLSSPVHVRDRLWALLGDRAVGGATVGPCGNVTLHFDGGPCLKVFNATIDYECWQVDGPGSRCVVVQGGGRTVDSEA